MVESNVTYLLISPKSERTSIRCKVYLSDRNTKGLELFISTGIRRVKPKDWSKRGGKQRLKPTATDSPIINGKLEEWEMQIRTICINAESVKDAEIKIRELFGIGPKQAPAPKRDIESLLNEFVAHKVRMGREYRTINLLKVSIRRLVKHVGNLTIDELKPTHLTSFCAALKADGLKDASVVYYLNQIKRALKWLKENGHSVDRELLYIEHKQRDRKKPTEYLTKDELKVVQESLVPERLQGTKDAFLFACYTGISAAERESVTRENIRKIKNANGNEYHVLEIRRQKTTESCEIALNKSAISIIKKYDWSLPKKHYVIMRKEMVELSEIWNVGKQVTYRVGRNTFASLMFEETNDLLLIQTALGHSNPSMTQKYIKSLTGLSQVKVVEME